MPKIFPLHQKIIIKIIVIIALLGVVTPAFAQSNESEAGSAPATASNSASGNVRPPKKTPTYASRSSDNPAGNSITRGLFFARDNFGLPDTDPRVVAVRLIRTALSFLGIIFLILVLYAGFLWMVSGGDDEKTAKAKKTLASAIIGIIIIFMANSIVMFVVNTFVAAGQSNNSSASQSL